MNDEQAAHRPDLCTVEDAARRLRVSRTTVYELIRTSELHTIHIRRSCRISALEIDRFIRERDRPQPDPGPRPPKQRRKSSGQDGLFDIDGGNQPAA